MTDEIKSMVTQVITSWQVIFITVALVAYLSLVFYVVRVEKVKKVVIPKIKVPKPKLPKFKKEAPKPSDEDEEELNS